MSDDFTIFFETNKIWFFSLWKSSSRKLMLNWSLYYFAIESFIQKSFRENLSEIQRPSRNSFFLYGKKNNSFLFKLVFIQNFYARYFLAELNNLAYRFFLSSVCYDVCELTKRIRSLLMMLCLRFFTSDFHWRNERMLLWKSNVMR